MKKSIPGAQLAMIDAPHFVDLENSESFNLAMRGFLEQRDAALP